MLLVGSSKQQRASINTVFALLLAKNLFFYLKVLAQTCSPERKYELSLVRVIRALDFSRAFKQN